MAVDPAVGCGGRLTTYFRSGAGGFCSTSFGGFVDSFSTAHAFALFANRSLCLVVACHPHPVWDGPLMGLPNPLLTAQVLTGSALEVKAARVVPLCSAPFFPVRKLASPSLSPMDVGWMTSMAYRSLAAQH